MNIARSGSGEAWSNATVDMAAFMSICHSHREVEIQKSAFPGAHLCTVAPGEAREQ